jgi:hypothetical protein
MQVFSSRCRNSKGRNAMPRQRIHPVALMDGVAGDYWKRTNNPDAEWAIVLEVAYWVAMEFASPEAALPLQFAGLNPSTNSMVAEE